MTLNRSFASHAELFSSVASLSVNETTGFQLVDFGSLTKILINYIFYKETYNVGKSGRPSGMQGQRFLVELYVLKAAQSNDAPVVHK